MAACLISEREERQKNKARHSQLPHVAVCRWPLSPVAAFCSVLLAIAARSPQATIARAFGARRLTMILGIPPERPDMARHCLMLAVYVLKLCISFFIDFEAICGFGAVFCVLARVPAKPTSRESWDAQLVFPSTTWDAQLEQGRGTQAGTRSS